MNSLRFSAFRKRLTVMQAIDEVSELKRCKEDVIKARRYRTLDAGNMPVGMDLVMVPLDEYSSA